MRCNRLRIASAFLTAFFLLAGSLVAQEPTLTLDNGRDLTLEGLQLNVVKINACVNVTLRKCRLNHIYVTGGREISIEDCVVDATANRTRPAVVMKSEAFRITDNEILMGEAPETNVYTGIAVVAENIEISSGVVAGNRITGGYTGIGCTGARNIEIRGNTIADCKSPRHSQGIIATECSGLRITGNDIRDIDYIGIALVDCSDSSIHGNHLVNRIEGANGEHTCGIAVSGNSRALTISGNTILGQRNGRGSTSSSGMNIRGNSHRITKNIVVVSTSPGDLRGLIMKDTERCAVSSNVFVANAIGVHSTDTAIGNRFSENLIFSSGKYSVLEKGTNAWLDNKIEGGENSRTGSLQGSPHIEIR